MRGGDRRSLPTAVKTARGNPGKQALNKKEPPAKVGLPLCPDDLTPMEQLRWDTLGKELVNLGVLTTLDGEAFRDLIEIETLNRELSQKIRGTDPVLEGNGIARKNPLWSAKLEYLRERRAQHEKFGMTPASRSKITAIDPKKADPLEDAIN